jgi:hypothetical protein
MHITFLLINGVGQVFNMNIGDSYHNAVVCVHRSAPFFELKKVEN